MSDWTQDEVNKAIELIGKKASTDADFRKLALTNPNEAVKKVMNKDVPSGYKLKIIENAAGVDQTFVLPNIQSEELSDADLDAVAGGGKCPNECDDQCASLCKTQCYAKTAPK